MTDSIKALIIDDEHDILFLLSRMLKKRGVEVTTAASVKESLEVLGNDTFDVCLTDLNLLDGSGFDIIEHVTQYIPDLPIAVITAYGSIDTAIKALKAGAYDYVTKPIQPEQLDTLIEASKKLKETSISSPNAATTEAFDQIVGDSEKIRSLKKQISRLARSQAPVFIFGESGTGKELVAKTLHNLGPRSDQAFIPINCGAIAPELVESELFGHVKGSFTGASQDRQGVFRAAEGGTLFLDEIGDLPLATQVKLLRVIQERRVKPVGSDTEYNINVRILSASHKDLQIAISEDQFRQDLFYRLNVIQLDLPSLRERKGDIKLIAHSILDKIAKEWNEDSFTLSDDAIDKLKKYPFPGNIRELENVLQRAVSLTDSNTISPDDINLEKKSVESLSSPSVNSGLDDENMIYLDPTLNLESLLEAIEKKKILEALDATRWNRTKAAQKLGLSFRSLRYRLKKLGLDQSDDE